MDSTSYTTYDNVWLKPRYNTQCKSHRYDYIIVHVDDFMIHLWDTKLYMAELQQLYQIWRIILISESSSVYLRIAIPRTPHGNQGFILFAQTYLVQALSTARILFDTIHTMTLKEGTLYWMAIIIMMTMVQIFWTDSSTKSIYNSLELINEFPPSAAWVSLMLLES